MNIRLTDHKENVFTTVPLSHQREKMGVNVFFALSYMRDICHIQICWLHYTDVREPEKQAKCVRVIHFLIQYSG